MLLALDSGLCSPGVALFLIPQQGFAPLRAAARIEIPDGWAALEDGRRWLEVAQEIVAWVINAAGASAITSVVFEKPQWYPESKSKVDPNSLVGMAGVAAGTVGILAGRHTLDVSSPTPREWIGQVPKVCPACHGKAKKKCLDCHGSAWETPRGRLIRSRLSADEFALVPDQNDAIDAVGIGLFRLGRLVPRRAFSNGR